MVGRMVHCRGNTCAVTCLYTSTFYLDRTVLIRGDSLSTEYDFSSARVEAT